MGTVVRPALINDQAAITTIVRAARINPTGLRWQRFFVAEQEGRVIGTAQVKPHHDGTRELASLAVVPERQGQGIGGALVTAIQEHYNPPLYLTCIDRMEAYYTRFGFRRIVPGELPPDLGQIYVVMNIILGLTRRGRLLVMSWNGSDPTT